MNEPRKSLYTKVDCIRLYVPDLESGLRFYKDRLGLRKIWQTESAIGLGMDEDVTEIVIQNEREGQEIDMKVKSVDEAIRTFESAGGNVVSGPFEIKIGKCAVVQDPWSNQYVILDSSKGLLKTDSNGNVIG